MKKLKTIQQFSKEFNDFELETSEQSSINGGGPGTTTYQEDHTTSAQGSSNTDCSTVQYWDDGTQDWADITLDEDR